MSPATFLWKLLCSFMSHCQRALPNILYLHFMQFLIIITPFTTINNNFQFVQPQLISLLFFLICQQCSSKMISRIELSVLGTMQWYTYTHNISREGYQIWLQMGTNSSIKISLHYFLTFFRRLAQGKCCASKITVLWVDVFGRALHCTATS